MKQPTKLLFVIILFLVAAAAPLRAQTDTVPPASFLAPGNQWTEFQFNAFNAARPGMARLRLSATDTLIDGRAYRTVLRSEEETGEDNFAPTDIYLRQTGARVYTWIGAPAREQREELIYDFGVAVGDTIDFYNRQTLERQMSKFVIVAKDTITLADGVPRRRLEYGPEIPGGSQRAFLIEGIGGITFGLLESTAGFFVDYNEVLPTCFGNDGQLLYIYEYGRLLAEGGDSVNCWPPTQSFPVSLRGPVPTGLDLRVAPNPTAGPLQLLTPAPPERSLVVDATGRIVLRSAGARRLDLTALPAGVYTLVVYGAAGRGAVRRIVKR